MIRTERSYRKIILTVFENRWFSRVKCGNETYYRKTRLPYEFKLIAILPTIVLETPIYTLLMISA